MAHTPSVAPFFCDNHFFSTQFSWSINEILQNIGLCTLYSEDSPINSMIVIYLFALFFFRCLFLQLSWHAFYRLKVYFARLIHCQHKRVNLCLFAFMHFICRILYLSDIERLIVLVTNRSETLHLLGFDFILWFKLEIIVDFQWN